ncbi:MAG: biotin/lipoate A/B protein ligase family protein [Sphingobium sp.]
MSKLVEKIASLISPDAVIERGEGQSAISRDAEILDQLLAADSEASFIRLWTNSRCLVTTRAVARMPAFAEAAAEAQASGWPVHVRHSGGSTVVHHPGILNISMFRCGLGKSPGIHDAYGDLIDRMAAALTALGVEVSTGSVTGSFCDGRYNIISDGRKIAGTACHSRMSRTGYAQLAHASLLVETNIESDIDRISRFERSLGLHGQYDRDAHASLAAILDKRKRLVKASA